MNRTYFLRGVSAATLALSVAFAGDGAMAQQNLPSIEVGAAHRGPVRHAAPAPQRPARVLVARPTPAPVPAPAPRSPFASTLPDGRPAFVEKFQIPATVASVTRRDIQEKINVIDTEDVVKYLPSLSVRKRNAGETQAVLQTRTWGYGSSARSLVYADDLLLTALVGNDNSIGAPRWGLVSPEEIERVDFLYGPFSAQYSGNSIGGVLQITTRMPEKLEITAKQTLAIQDFSLYGTSRTLPTELSEFTVGDKIGNLSWLVTGSFLNTYGQPLTYVNAGTNNLYGYPGAYFANTKFGLPATVLGSAGNLDKQQANGKLKLAYDITPTIRATYTLGFWSNDGTSLPENYLVKGYGPYFGATPTSSPIPSIGSSASQSFGSAYYRVQEKMLTNALAVKSNTGGIFDFEASASHFTYLQSDQRSPYSAANLYGGYTSSGKDARGDGTYWTLLDLKGIVRPEGRLKGHDISFGLHGDQFHLNGVTWLTTNWTQGMASSFGVPLTVGDGTTRTQALWLQDAWKINSQFKATVGIRGEHFTATDGFNQQFPTGNLALNGIGATLNAGQTLADVQRLGLGIFQPNQYHTRFSPKGALQWTPDELWTVTASVGLANRFPTAKELYNLTATNASTGAAASPNPNLRPEVALSKELAFERKIRDGSVRVSLFDEEVRDAIISQTIFVPGTTTSVSNNTNISRIRNSGVELAARRDNVLFNGLELSGSATYLNARIISDPTWAPSGNVANLDAWALRVDGKNAPNVPKWRWTVGATYRPDDQWAFSVNARYQGRMWTTLTNNDTAHGVYQAFDRFFVVDTKVHYKWSDRWSFDFGIDNIGNYKYFLFHPFPQRTFTMAAKYEFGTSAKNQPGIFFAGNEAGLPDVKTWFRPAAFSID